MFVNGSELNEQSSYRTFQGCFLPNFEDFVRNQPIRNKNCLWWSCLLTDWDEMSNLYINTEPSIDASYQVSVHLPKRFQRRRLKCEKLTDDKWWQKLTLPLARWAKNEENKVIYLHWNFFIISSINRKAIIGKNTHKKRNYFKRLLDVYISIFNTFYFQWVSDCCLTSSQQFFSYIMARTSSFSMSFVLDQHA